MSPGHFRNVTLLLLWGLDRSAPSLEARRHAYTRFPSLHCIAGPHGPSLTRPPASCGQGRSPDETKCLFRLPCIRLPNWRPGQATSKVLSRPTSRPNKKQTSRKSPNHHTSTPPRQGLSMHWTAQFARSHLSGLSCKLQASCRAARIDNRRRTCDPAEREPYGPRQSRIFLQIRSHRNLLTCR